MDGVLANFETPNNTIVQRYYPSVFVDSPRTNFYYRDSYRNHPEVVQKIESECRKPGFIRSFPVIENALHGWERIIEAGYIPRVCSSPLENHKTVINEKKQWLEEHFVPKFGPLLIDLAIFDRDKSKYPAIAIIDDRPTLRNSEKATWQHIVFSTSYNLEVDTAFRLHGWLDPSLKELLNRSVALYKTKK